MSSKEGDVNPGKNAAKLAQNAIEEALFAIPQIPLEMDRAGIGQRLRRAIQCAYAVLEMDVLAPAHHDGLTEAFALVHEARTLMGRAGDRRVSPALGKALDGLDLAGSALKIGAEAVAQIQLARRAELTGAGPGRAEPPPGRPFRASRGTPGLFAIPRRPLVPESSLDPLVPLPAPAAPSRKLKRPDTLEALKAFAASAASGELAKELAGEEQPPEKAEDEPPLYAYQPSVEEAEMLRRLGRDCLEDIAIHRDLRKPNAIETWLDQEPFEQRLLDNLDCFAAVGGAALPLVSLYFAEAKSPDPGRAFAVALTLGSIEGRDTIDAAIATLKQSAPETYPGWVEGFHLAPNPAIDAALIELATGPRPALVAVALEVLALRQTAPFELVRRFATSDRPELAERAARALAVSGPRDQALALLEDIMATAEDDAVFLAAAESAMRRSHGGARPYLRAALARSDRPARASGAAWLLCLGGQSHDLEALLARVRAVPTAKLVRGLGRFGHVETLGPLVGLLGSADEQIVDAAAEALERITGAGLRETVEEPWEIALPPEAREATTMPMPTRKVEKVVTDAAGWNAWLREHAGRFDPSVRTRGGRPFSPSAIVLELASKSTPPPRRHEAALELAIATRLATALSPDDWVARQREHLSELVDRVERLALPVGTWSFGVGDVSLEEERPAVPDAEVEIAETITFKIKPAQIPHSADPALPFVRASTEKEAARTARPDVRDDALPFIKVAPDPAPAAVAISAAPLEVPDSADEMVETQPVPNLPAPPSLPFPRTAPRAAPAPPRLSLEQHAWLCADLAFAPENKPAILEHYGVDEECRQQLDGFWGIRMQLNESLRRAWEGHYDARQEQLRRTGGGKR